REVSVDHASNRRTELCVRPNIDESCHPLAGGSPEERRPIGELILQIVRNIPGLVRYFAVVSNDRGEMLPAQGTDRLDVCKSHWMDVEIDALVGERISDSPGERAGPPSLKAHTLVERQSHRPLRGCTLTAHLPVPILEPPMRHVILIAGVRT